MNYGNYDNKAFQTNFEEIKSTKSLSDKESNLELKTSEISQQIFPNIQSAASTELKDINAQALPKNSENILQNEEEINSKENFLQPESDISSKNKKFDSMTLDELEEIILTDKNLSEEDSDKIMLKIEELESQKHIENIEYNKENIDLTKEKVETSTQNIDLTKQSVHIEEDNATKDLKAEEEKQKIHEDGQVKGKEEVKIETNLVEIKKASLLRVFENGVFRLIKSDMLGDNFAVVDMEKGEISVPKGHNLIKGQKYKVEDEEGNIREFEPKKIHELSDEEIDAYKQAHVIHYKNLQANALTENDEKKHQGLDSNPLATKNRTTENKNINENPKNQAKQVRPNLVDVVLTGTKKSTKEINEERREKFEEAQDILDGIIKKTLLNHEQLVQEIKSSDLSFAIKNMDQKSLDLYNKSIENDVLSQDILNNLQKIRKETNIPLSHFVRFIKLERSFKELIKLLPKESIGKDKDMYEALTGVLSFQKEFIDLVQESLSSNHETKTTNTSNLGRTLGAV